MSCNNKRQQQIASHCNFDVIYEATFSAQWTACLRDLALHQNNVLKCCISLILGKNVVYAAILSIDLNLKCQQFGSHWDTFGSMQT
jgi:hypothetical protein